VIRKFSLLLTILAALGLIVALVGCGKRGALEAPPQDSALEQPHRTA
jgi:predicted small lipoprotein YifL|tara:strand:+ start:278 stop:418 length:141 start_codon:yes stop_codon:yes gene_type:complete